MNSSAVNSTAAKPDDLEFPVDSSFAPPSPEMSLDDAMRLIEQLRASFPNAMETEHERLARKVGIEFVIQKS